MFKVNPVREVKFHEVFIDSDTDENCEFSVTFNFKPSEDIDYVELRKKMEDKTPLEIEDKDGKITKTDVGSYNAFLYTLRTALSDWDGIADPEGNPLPAKDDKGKIIIANQIAVFEAIKSIPAKSENGPSLLDKITKAYIGEKGKNA